MTNNNFYINEVHIKSFRGLSDLKLESCNKFNLILGSSDIGKTSLLEAIFLGRNGSPYNFIDVLRNRHTGTTTISDISWLYPKQKDEISFAFKTSHGKINYSSNVNYEKVIFDQNIFSDKSNNSLTEQILNSFIETLKINGKELPRLTGVINYNNEQINYSYLDLDVIGGRITNKNSVGKNIVYLSPDSHFQISITALNRVLKNDPYKKVLIKIMQLFEEDVEDILFLNKTDLISSQSIYIKRKDSSPEPLSIYGDGLKKAVNLAIGLSEAKDGVLLIDEIETSLYFKHFSNIIGFILKACEFFNVQVFATTHSLEFIESLIEINDDSFDGIFSIYTLRRSQRKTTAARLDSSTAKNLVQNSKTEIRE